MAVLFVPQPGQVVAIPDPYDVPIPISFSGWGGTGEMKCIITEIGIVRQGNYQLLHTLQDLVYVYVFGERAGQFRVSGIAFTRSCGDDSGGIDALNEYYEANRIGARSDPLAMVVGTSAAGVFSGFLVGLNVAISRPEARLAQFTLDFQTLPRTTRGSSSGAPTSTQQTASPASKPSGRLSSVPGE